MSVLVDWMSLIILQQSLPASFSEHSILHQWVIYACVQSKYICNVRLSPDRALRSSYVLRAQQHNKMIIVGQHGFSSNSALQFSSTARLTLRHTIKLRNYMQLHSSGYILALHLYIHNTSAQQTMVTQFDSNKMLIVFYYRAFKFVSFLRQLQQDQIL